MCWPTPDSHLVLPTHVLHARRLHVQPRCGRARRNNGPKMVRPTRQPPCAHPSTRRRSRPAAPSLITGCAIALGGRWNAKTSSALQCPARFRGQSLLMVRAPCPIVADEQRRALDDDGDSLERRCDPTHIGRIQAEELTRMCAAAAPTPCPLVARRATPTRPALALRAPHDPGCR